MHNWAGGARPLLVKRSVLTDTGVGCSNYKKAVLSLARWLLCTEPASEAVPALPLAFPRIIRKHTQSSFSAMKGQLIGL